MPEPDASSTVKGITKLDVNPVSSTNPIAVGVNSARLTKVLSVDYSNSLATAVSTISTTETTLIVKADTTVSTAVTVPPNIILKQEDFAIISKSSSGTIEFEGFGLAEPGSKTPFFSGFDPGDITFTGDDYPSELSTELFDTGNDSLTERVALADLALEGKTAVLILYPRTITDSVTITENHVLYFTPGDYLNELNTIGTTGLPAFRLKSNTTVTGTKEARIHESPYDRNVYIFYTYAINVSGSDGHDDNVFIENLSFIGNPEGGDSMGQGATILFCNTRNGAIRNCYFYQTHGYTTFLNGYATAGNYCVDCVIENNTFVGIAKSQASIANAKNCHIRNNIFDMTDTFGDDVPQSPPLAYNYPVIDIEPNGEGGVVDNLSITGNLFDYSGEATDGSRYSTAIFIQAGAFPSANAITVSNNIILGRDLGPGDAPLITGISAYGVQEFICEDNYIRAAYGLAMYFFNIRYAQIHNNKTILASNGASTIAALQLHAVADSDISDNKFNAAFSAQAQATGIVEGELEFPVTASGSVITNAQYYPRFYAFWANAMTVTLNATDYTTSAVNTTAQTLTVTAAPGTLTVKTAASSTDVNIVTHTITLGSHNFVNGCRLKYTAGTEAIGGLTTGTTYFVVGRTATTIQLAATLGGSPINLTSTGTGTQTFTPVLVTKFSSNTYRDNKAEDGITLEPTGTSIVYSRYTDFQKRGTVTINPASIAANSVSTQSFTLTGAVVGDSLTLNVPAAGLTTGLLVLQAWVSATNEIKVTFQNTTGGAIDEASSSWNYTLFR